ncbi:hypothetical protein KF913_20460 [Candidatus Obscuribacterales bacterium]|nr:hypothetical protein [Candidatus Obscuribacterales bacterium]
MRILILVLALLLFGASVNPMLAASDSSQSSDSDYYNTDDNQFVKQFLKPGSFMRVSEVRPGMEGYGLSVFKGTKIERFDVRVIGVMKRVNNGKDAILVRLSGPAMGKNNVIRGMSGSPVYINDKLIGAVSYGFDFSTEPIAGVTPIVDMLDAMAKPHQLPKIGSHLPTKRAIALTPSAVSAPTPELSRFRRMLAGANAPRMVPLMSPVSLSGFSSRAQEFLRKRFEPVGLSVSDGAGGALDSNIPADEIKEANALKPGSAMGVMLTTGDFESASTGTVTANFGGRVVGFGHPFVEAGLVDFPMTSAYILDVLPSLSISFKLSAPIQVLGTLYSDRPWSVGGQIGNTAKMLPVSIEVTDNERHVRKTFSSKVIDHEDLTPELVAACAMSAVDATYQSNAPYVARVETNVEIDNGSVINRTDCLTNGSGSGISASLFRPFFADPVSGSVHSIASRILGNRYKKVHLKSVKLKINLEAGRDLTRIVRVSTDRSVVRPGEKVKLNCLLEPYDGEPYTESIDVTIPRSVPDGDIVIGVSGGSQLDDLRKRMNLIDPPTTSLEQIIKRIQDRPRGDRLFAVLALPDQAIHVDGEVIESPPGHWTKLFFSNRYTHGPSLVNGERRISKELASLVEGTHILAVTVKRPDPFLEVAPSYTASPGGSGKASMGAYVTLQAQKAIDALHKGDAKAKTDASAASSSDASKQSASLSLWSSSSDDTHIRPVQVWSQTDDISYKGGTKDGIIIDSWGRMFPGFKEDSAAALPTLRAWSAVWSKGAVYIGSTNKIYRWNPGATHVDELVKVDSSAAIPAIAADSKGRLYAAVAPGGRIVSFDPNSTTGSKLTTVASLNEPLVTCLTVDSQDNLYAGVADSGKVYKLTAGGAASLLADTGDAHVLSLFFDNRIDRLYIGSGEQGNVYSVGKDGKLRAEFHSDDHLVTGVCRSKSGDTFITTAGPGRLIRISPSGETFELATSEAFFTLYYHPETDSIFAGDAEGDITQIQEEPLTRQSFFVPVKHTEQEAVVALCSDNNNHLFAVTSNLPSVFSFSVKPDAAAYTSPVKDAGREARWSLLRVYGSFNEISADLERCVAVETRTGETVRPDSTWSGWASAPLTTEGYQVKSANGRYFQYRLKWVAAPPKVSDRKVFPEGRESVLGRVTVTYLPTNLRPRFSTVSLRAGSYINDTEEVAIVGADPDGDSLSLSIDVSSDNGENWKSLKSDLRAERTLKKDSKTDSLGEKKDNDKKDDKQKTNSTAGDGGEKRGEAGERNSPPAGTSPGENGSGSDKTVAPAKDSGDAQSDSDDESKDSDDGVTGDDSNSSSTPIPNPNPDPVPGEDPASSHERFMRLKRNESAPDTVPPEFQRLDEKRKPVEKNAPARPGTGALKKTEPKKPEVRAARKLVPGSVVRGQSKTRKASEAEQPDKFVWPLAAGSFKDGHYIFRFTLSDAPSNMVQPEEIQCYRYVVIDTEKPVIAQAKAAVSPDLKLTLDVMAKDNTSPIANATFQVDSEEPRAFEIVDGLADKRDVHCLASGVPVKKGAHKVEIEISDRAGNKVTKTLRLPSH